MTKGSKKRARKPAGRPALPPKGSPARPSLRPGTRPGRSRRSIGRFRNLGFVAALAAAVVGAIILIGVANLFRGDDDNTSNTIDIPDHTAPAEGMTLGDADAPITIYVYSDFQCPFCQRAAAEVVPELDTEYLATGTAKLIFKNFAFLDEGFEGQESKNAAEAAACASEQGKFWEYHNKLFENQEGENKGAFKVENLKRFAAEIGLNQGDFDTCFDERRYAARIADERQEAENRGVNSTPTFFVNQTEIIPASFGELYGDLVEAIEAVLVRLGLATPQATGTPEGTAYSKNDPEYQLASLDSGTMLDLNDPSIGAYARALDAAAAKCTNGRRAISDFAVTGQQQLADEGIEVTLLQAVRAIDESIPDGSPKLDCAEIAAAWVTLQIGQ